MMKKRKNQGQKSKAVQFLEYVPVYWIILFSRLIPFKVFGLFSYILGSLLYILVPSRRNIAIDNIQKAFKDEKNEKEVKKLAHRSFISFFIMISEVLKLRFSLKERPEIEQLIRIDDDVRDLFKKAKKVHDESGGCIFVTPHIGNWEILPYVSSLVGIELAILVRPLDNVYLEKLIYADRASTGQLVIPKRNAFLNLKKILRQGKSIGILPDQGMMRGIEVDFFGRNATNTPVPALLSIMFQKPIVVVACCRKAGSFHFDGFVSDPIWPTENHKNEKEEIFRITRKINKEMEKIIRQYPEQYLWIHRRWKQYEGTKPLFS